MEVVKARFEDFLSEYPNKEEFRENTSAETIFNFLSDDKIIQTMIDSINNGNSALEGCVKELEIFAKENILKDFDIRSEKDKYKVHLAIGQMIKTILKPFGYETTGIRKDVKSKNFINAMCYEKVEE